MNMKCDELLMYVRNKTSIMFNFTVMYCHCYIQGPVALKFSYHEQNGYVNTFHRGRTESINKWVLSKGHNSIRNTQWVKMKLISITFKKTMTRYTEWQVCVLDVSYIKLSYGNRHVIWELNIKYRQVPYMSKLSSRICI